MVEILKFSWIWCHVLWSFVWEIGKQWQKFLKTVNKYMSSGICARRHNLACITLYDCCHYIVLVDNSSVVWGSPKGIMQMIVARVTCYNMLYIGSNMVTHTEFLFENWPHCMYTLLYATYIVLSCNLKDFFCGE